MVIPPNTGPQSKFVHMNEPICFSSRTTGWRIAVSNYSRRRRGGKLVKISTQHHDNINVWRAVEHVYCVCFMCRVVVLCVLCCMGCVYFIDHNITTNQFQIPNESSYIKARNESRSKRRNLLSSLLYKFLP